MNYGYYEEFVVGQRVRISEWMPDGEPDPLGRVVAVRLEREFSWCGDVGCCSPPVDYYDVELDSPIPEGSIETNIPCYLLHAVIAQ